MMTLFLDTHTHPYLILSKGVSLLWNMLSALEYVESSHAQERKRAMIKKSTSQIAAAVQDFKAKLKPVGG
jgi:hypothetical protein